MRLATSCEYNVGIAGTALGLWALAKSGSGLLGGIGSGETIIAGNNLGYGATAAGGFGYTPSEVYMSAKQCEDNVALTRAIYDMRIKDLQEKTGIYNYFNDKFCQVEKQVAALEQAKPYEQKILDLQFQLAQNHSDRYTDKKTCGVIYGVNVLSRRYSDQSYSHNQMNMRQGDEKGYCDLRMMEHVKEHGYHLDKEMLECGLLLLDFEDHEEPWTVEETERARKNNGLHFNGEYSSVNKYDFNFIMNKKKAKDKYEGRSINELAYKSYESLTDDSFPYPEAKAYFIFLTYLYSTMAEKHKLFK